MSLNSHGNFSRLVVKFTVASGYSHVSHIFLELKTPGPDPLSGVLHDLGGLHQ